MALTNLPYISNLEKSSLTKYYTVGTSWREVFGAKGLDYFSLYHIIIS